MKKTYTFLLEILNKAIKLGLTFLCLGVIIQLLVDDKLVFEQMRPSETFNSIINNIIPLVYKCI